MKGLKILLIGTTPLLLILGILFKIYNGKFWFTFPNGNGGVNTITFTGNRLLAAAIVFAAP